MPLMTFRPNPDALTDTVKVYTKTYLSSQEGSRREVQVEGKTLACSVQPVVGAARQYQGLGDIGVDADYRAVFMEDPAPLGVAVHAVLRQVSRFGQPVLPPLAFEVVLVQPDGGPSLTWTAYLKFRG